jgi:hypothetical protein
VPLGVAFKRQGARSALRGPRWFAHRGCLTLTCISGCGLTFEFTRLRKRAKPAVAGRVQRRVRPRHACYLAERSFSDERSFVGKHARGSATTNQAMATSKGTARNHVELPFRRRPTTPTSEPSATQPTSRTRRRSVAVERLPRCACWLTSGLTFEFTRLRKRAKPAVAGRVQRRVRPHRSKRASIDTAGDVLAEFGGPRQRTLVHALQSLECISGPAWLTELILTVSVAKGEPCALRGDELL